MPFLMAFSVTCETWENVEVYLKHWRLSSQRQQLGMGSAALPTETFSCCARYHSTIASMYFLQIPFQVFLSLAFFPLNSHILQFHAVCPCANMAFAVIFFPHITVYLFMPHIFAHSVVSLISEISESPHYGNFNHL